MYLGLQNFTIFAILPGLMDFLVVLELIKSTLLE